MRITPLNTLAGTISTLTLAIGLTACGGGGSSDSTGSGRGLTFTVNSAAAIAQESDSNYDNNVSGLVSGATLKRWLDNWPANRPAGITGRLIILQASAGPSGTQYIKSDGVNVFTYLSPSSDWTQTRINGVIETTSMVSDGTTMDATLKKFGIDPTKDLIVAAMGTGSTGNAMSQGRIWYALRYWGVAKEHLAILNGGNQWLNGNGLTAADFQATASTAPNNGTFSVANLTDVNTDLQITLDELIKLVPTSDSRSSGLLLWDARSLGQYSAGLKVEYGEDTDANTSGTQACASAYCTPVDTSNYQWTFQNGGSRQGHPFGALQLQYTNLLDATKGYAYKAKPVLAAYLDGTPDARGVGLLDANYNLVGAGNGYRSGDTVVVYCETTFRAMITGIASGVILGKPTRFYDGAMIEWNSLSNLPDKTGATILPADSPWRTDIRSFFRPATAASLVNTRNITGPYAASANAIVNADKAYKSGVVIPTGGSGGLPGNPCGG